MRKKYLSALLFGALLFASAGTFTSCKDYDDDIKDLQGQIDGVVSDLASLKEQIATSYVQSVTFDEATGNLVVTTMANGTSSSQTYTVKTAAGGAEVADVKVEIKGQELIVNGETIGKVGDTVAVSENGELTVNGEATGITVGKYAILTDQSQGTVTIQLPNANGEMETVTLMTSAAALTAVQIEDLKASIFGDIERTDGGIQWGVAAKATPDWAGTKGAIAMNQLLIGQISTVNVQVTPADYDLEAQELTLVDARGNQAPVKVTPVANNLLLPVSSRTASSNGSWILTISIDETQVNAANIADVFKYDPESNAGDPEMGYTLCVNGKPFTTFDFGVKTAEQKSPNTNVITVNNTTDNLMFIDADGRVKEAGEGKIPVGTTTLYVAENDLYDYYLTFEGTNKSLANQYGIKIGDDKKSIVVPAGAEGVKISVTVHTASITGQISPVAGDAVTTNQVELQIAGTEIEAAEIAATTHVVKPGDALKEIRVDFKTADGKSVFESFPAANLEAARKAAQFKVVESASQVGFLVNSEDPKNGQCAITATNIEYYKADDKPWTSDDDMLDLSYMKITVENNVATDAVPGDYQLTFIATDDNSVTTVEGNELIKVTVPVSITVPEFKELFDKDQNWTENTYTSRIIIKGQDPYIEYANAFKDAGNFDVEASHIKVTFNALDEYNNYPIDITLSNVDEYVTENTRGVTTYISNDIKLDKENVYNEDGNALEVSKLTGMYAYYDTFDGETNMGTGDYSAVKQAFAIVSDAFDTQIKTALDGITAAVYNNNTVVNPVIIGDDNIIPAGSGDGKKDSEFNGFVIRLGSDYLHVNKNNLDGGTQFEKLGIFQLFDSEVGTAYTGQNNEVKVTFEGANNETIGWDGNKGPITVDMDDVDSSTLYVTFTDATGIVYKKEIKIQKER